MNEKEGGCGFRITVFIAGLILGAVGGIAIASFSFSKPVDWPAWVQAVGSVAAIFATIFVLSKQTKDQQEFQQREWDRKEKIRLQEQKEIFCAAINLLDEACYVSESTINFIKSGELTDIKTNNPFLSVWLKEIEHLDITREPLVGIASEIVKLKLQFRALLNQLSKRQNQEIEWPALKTRVRMMSEVTESLQKKKNDYLTKVHSQIYALS